MKKITTFMILVFMVHLSAPAQFVKSLNDLPLINQEIERFIDKPLCYLLGEIEPEIKLFFAEEGSDVRLGTL